MHSTDSHVLKEVTDMKKIIAELEEFLEAYYKTFA